MKPRKSRRSRARELTGRERQRIAVMFICGRRNDKNIAGVFGIHPRTVERLRASYFRGEWGGGRG